MTAPEAGQKARRALEDLERWEDNTSRRRVEIQAVEGERLWTKPAHVQTARCARGGVVQDDLGHYIA